MRVGLCGLLGTGNLGNDGSMEAVLGIVREQFPDAEFGCLCSGPGDIRARFGLSTTRLNWYQGEYRTATGLAVGGKLLGKFIDPFRIWNWVRRYDVVIVPGMGVLEGSLPMRPWGWPYSLFLVCLAGRLARTKVALVCVGADGLARPVTRRVIAMAARLAHYRSYRDSASRDALRAMGLKRAESDEVFADLAFALPLPPAERARRGVAGVGVMALPDRSGTRPGLGQHRTYLGRITEFVEWLLDHGYDVHLLTGDREDEAVARGIRDDLGARRADVAPERLTTTTPTSLADLLTLMRPLDAIVATRYHNIVCALRLGKPTVSIGYAAKNDILMAEMGLADACQRTGTLDVPRLVEQFRAVLDRGDMLEQLAAERTGVRTRLLRKQAAALTIAVFPAGYAATAVTEGAEAADPGSTVHRRAVARGRRQLNHLSGGHDVNVDAVKRTIRRIEDRAYRALTAAGLGQTERTLAAQAHDYWSRSDTGRWESDSHWRDAPVFAGGDIWASIGARHLEMVDRAARAVGYTRPWGRVLEWGCGGGANAVHFAPRAGEFVGVDLTAKTLAECGRQVAAVCDTPWKPVHVDVSTPEAAAAQVEPCDLWLCYYVFELVPSREYGARLLRIAHDMLAPGGLASIQIKYSDGSWATRPRRWGYGSAVAGMTAYRIEEFWSLASECGFVPELVELRPHDELDERYAYFTLRRP